MSGEAGRGRVRRFGEFTFDPASGELWRGSSRVRLQAHSALVLDEFTSRPGEVITREELVARLWPKGVVDFEAGLNTAVRRLRIALGDDADRPIFIETLPRRGYRFLTRVESAERQARSSWPSSRWIALGTCALLAAVALGVWWQRLPAAGPKIESLAVLPFKNFADDASQQFFVDGFTDELITRLAKIRPLRVVSSTTAFSYAGSDKPLPEIARELGVDAFVEGSVLRDGNHIRVTAQLVRADDVHVWADSFEADFADVLRLQRDITIQIARQVQVSVDPSPTAERPVIPEAYEAFLRGRHLWNTFRARNWPAAIAEFERAIALDPGFARAWGGLADTHMMTAAYQRRPANEAMPKARDAARRALELDPGLASAQVTLAHIRMAYEWDWDGARRQFEQALELDPGYALGHHWYANWFTAMGRYDEAIREHERARDLDPMSLIINTNLCRAHLFARHYDRAIDICRKTLELDAEFGPALNWLFEAYRRRPDTAAAAGVLAAMMAPGSGAQIAEMESAVAEHGLESYVRRDAARLLASQRANRGYTAASILAEYSVIVGDRQAALAFIEQAERDRDFYLIFAGAVEDFAPLWSEPRFRRIRDTMGLPQVTPP